MKVISGVLAVLTLALANVASARAPDVDKIRHWNTPTFTIYGTEASIAQAVAAQVAPIERVLATLLEMTPQPTGLPLVIYIAPESVWHRYLRPSDEIYAESVPGRFANYILMASTQSEAWARQVLNHEYAHYFLRSQFGGEFPLWFDEGLAEVVRTTDFWSQMVRTGLPLAKAWHWLPLGRVLHADKQSPEYLSSLTSAFHYQSWALVHWGLLHDRKFGAKIFEYLRLINGGEAIEEAVPASFGMSMVELERALAGYTRRGTYNFAKFPFEWPQNVVLEPGRRMSELEGFELLAQTMLDTGLNPTRASEVIGAVNKSAPGSAAARVLELRLVVRDGSDADVERAWLALEPLTGEPAVARSAGLALFQRIRAELTGEMYPAHALDMHARRAYDLLAISERVLPVDAESAWAFGVLSAHLGLETQFALQRLEVAASAVPRSGDLSAAAALLHEKLGQTDLMRDQLAKVARFSRSVQQIAWAKKRLDSATSKQERP